LFRTSYVHLQVDYTVYAAVYGTFSLRLFNPPTCFAYDEFYVVSVTDSNTESISHHHSAGILAAEKLPELHSISVAEGLAQFEFCVRWK